MKKLKMLFLGISLALMPFLQSCDDTEGYSIGDFATPVWATLHTNGDDFFLRCDSWGTLWPINQNLHNGTTSYQPKDGQRVIVAFNPLQDEFYGYDHAIQIQNIQEVLTKNIETLHADKEEMLGDDPIAILKGNLWISENHLNVIFRQDMPAKEKHLLSLVRPASDDELYGEDGYIHLQLRYNDQDDLTGRLANGAASFSLNTLNTTGNALGIKLEIHSIENGKVVVELPFEAKP